MTTRAFFYLQEPAPRDQDRIPQYLDFEFSKIAEVFRRESAYGKYDALTNTADKMWANVGDGSDATRNSDSTLHFPVSVDRGSWGISTIPHTWKVGSPIIPYVQWCPLNTNTGNVVWRLDMAVWNVGEYAAGYTQHGTNPTVAANGTTGNTQETLFDEKTMTAEKEGALIGWHLRRMGADAADTYTGTVKLFVFGFYYCKEKHGTNTPTPGS